MFTLGAGIRFSQGTSVNTPFFQETTREFDHSDVPKAKLENLGNGI